MADLRFNFGERLTIRDADGTVLSTPGRKECGVLALVALSPERRRTRSYLQDKLWSDRPGEKAQANLRRALSNIRKHLGPHRGTLRSDNRAVWLAPSTEVIVLGDPQDDDFLCELAIDDPEFQDWLRTSVVTPAGARQDGTMPPDPLLTPPVTPPLTLPRGLPTRISLLQAERLYGDAEQEMLTALLDALSERLSELGPLIVQRSAHGLPGDIGDRGAELEGGSDLSIELDTSIAAGNGTATARLTTGAGRFYLWSGRARFTYRPGQVDLDAALAQFLNHVVTATYERSFQRFRGSRFFQIQHAGALLFTGQRRDLKAADTILRAIDPGPEGAGLVSAWRCFGHLTNALEFGEMTGALRDEANDLACEALKTGQTNPLVLALVAQVEMKLNRDPERAAFLAGRAMSFGSNNAYALSAAGHAATFLGEMDRSYDLSTRALAMARGLPHEFIWQMQLSLAALAVGRIDEAWEHCRLSHLGMARYRPALRYLAALSLIRGDAPQAARFEQKLRRLEPGFALGRLKDPTYPVDTLRALGLDEAL